MMRALMRVFMFIFVVRVFVVIRLVVFVRMVVPSTAVKQDCGWTQRPQGR